MLLQSVINRRMFVMLPYQIQVQLGKCTASRGCNIPQKHLALLWFRYSLRFVTLCDVRLLSDCVVVRNFRVECLDNLAARHSQIGTFSIVG